MKHLEIFFSLTAKKQFEDICHYILTEWSFKEKEEFKKRLQKKLSQISQHPKSCPKSSFMKGLRKAVVDKRTSIFYRFSIEYIEVIIIIDNSQSESTVKKSIG